MPLTKFKPTRTTPLSTATPSPIDPQAAKYGLNSSDNKALSILAIASSSTNLAYVENCIEENQLFLTKWVDRLHAREKKLFVREGALAEKEMGLEYRQLRLELGKIGSSHQFMEKEVTLEGKTNNEDKMRIRVTSTKNTNGEEADKDIPFEPSM
jgi:hypothetical protein